MNLNIDFPIDVVEILISIVVWSIIIIWIYLTFKKKQAKLKIWMVIIFTFVGILSFSINFSLLGNFFKFPVLPLGVWILNGWYFKSKKDTWTNYREFAWIGFFSNFFFLLSSLLSSIIHGTVYPKDELSTYVSNVEKASIIEIHPSGNYQTINVIKLQNQIEWMEKTEIYSDKWYEETWQGETPKYERFPYQLLGISPKWGSGIRTIIYIEKDGKGILIDTPQKQVYFRSEEAFLERVKKK